MNFRYSKENFAKSRANCRRIYRSAEGKCCFDTVSVRRDPMSRSRCRPGYHVYWRLRSEREFTEMGARSRAGRGNRQDREIERAVGVTRL